jgi:hypothetical protein
MRKLLPVLMIGALLLTVTALAQGPKVTTPKEGDRVGPAIDVKGDLGHKGLIVIITDVWRLDKNEKVSSVPGIRHYSEDNGTFDFHVATPRNPWDKTVSIEYRVRVFELKGPNNPGPETVVKVRPKEQ